MHYMLKQPTEVDAMQFDGTEASAAAVIEWAASTGLHPDVHRHLHRGSWNDEHPDLWLEVQNGRHREWVEPGSWLVIDVPFVEVLSDATFRAEYVEAAAP